MRRLVSSLSLFLVAALAVPALADPPRMVVEKDGTVFFDGKFFGSAEAFHNSTEFKNSGLRCATESDKAMLFDRRIPLKAAADCTMSSTTIRSEYNPGSGSVYTIPVVFHIIKKTDGTGDLAQSLITSQVDILNEDYRALTGTPGASGSDAKIQFALATEDPSGNPTSGITSTTSNAYFTDPGPGAANDMKQALNWDPTRYLNIYTNDANGALGYATFPQQDAGSYQDGVVLLWSSVGRNAPGGGIYDQGRTATHEVGHYLGLFHTFQSGCGSAGSPYTTGDLIADTNQQQSANFNCPAGASSCSSPDPIENYMNYTQDTCMEKFTTEQINRMRCAIDSYRPNLGTGGGGGGGGTVLENGVPKIGLSAATGSALNYTMDVPSGASDLEFAISGGTGDADLYVRFGSAPTTSTYDCRPYGSGNNESCPFASPSAGTWYVMVRAYNTYSGVSLVGSYSTGPANTAPTAGFTHSTSDLTASFTDTSTDSDGTIVSWSWSFGDSATSSSQNPTHTYAAAGTYTVSLTVTDDDGATDSTSASVTVTAPPTSNELENGVPVTGLSAATGQELDSTMVVPSGATDLVLEISGGTGDADLYVRFGAAPTTSTYDCRPYKGGNAETCTFATPSAGTWYVMVRAYNAFTGLTLEGRYTTGGGGGGGAPCTGCDPYSGSLSGSGDSDVHPDGTYYYSASGTHDGWLEGPASADFDLELYRWNGSAWSKVSSSTSASSSEHISYSGTTGYYYWKILSYNGSGSYDFWLQRP